MAGRTTIISLPDIKTHELFTKLFGGKEFYQYIIVISGGSLGTLKYSGKVSEALSRKGQIIPKSI
jgi:hypothetical protein